MLRSVFPALVAFLIVAVLTDAASSIAAPAPASADATLLRSSAIGAAQGSTTGGFFGRGDADCSLTFAAADVVAVLRGLRGESVCGNDDCDRDGRLTANDVACAASCLFGECAVPANAPRVVNVEPGSAPAIVPASIITVSGTNFGSDDGVKRVTIGGREAPVLDFSDGTLTVAVPNVGEGSQDLVVFDGDLAGLPVSITVAASDPIGTPDTLEDLLQLADEFVVDFLALDLAQAYDEDLLVILLDALEDFRAALDAVDLQADPDLTPEIISEIDAIIDASGAADVVRAAIADLRSARRALPRQEAVITKAVEGVSKLAWQLRGSVTVATEVAAASATTAAQAALAIEAAQMALLAGTAFILFELPPVAAGDPVFFDADGEKELLFPVSSGRVRMPTNNFIDAGIDLVAKTAHGEFRRAGTSCGSNCREYRLPENIGFCGQVTFKLARGPVRSDRPFRSHILPTLIDLSPNRVGVGDLLDLVVAGVKPCDARVLYEGPKKTDQVPDALPKVYRSDRFEEKGDSFVHVRAGHPGSFGGPDSPLRALAPGDYDFRIEVEERPSLETEPLEFVSPITGLRVACEDSVIVVDSFFPTTPPFDPATLGTLVTTCGVETEPADTTFPLDSNVEWKSTTSAVDPVSQGGAVVVRPVRHGSAEIFATLTARGVLIAESNRFLIEVRDTLGPLVETEFVPACGSSARPESVSVEATDNLIMSRIRLKVEQAGRRVFEDVKLCPAASSPQQPCTAEFSIPGQTSFEPGMLVLEVEATDEAGNETSQTCLYTIPGPPTPTPCRARGVCPMLPTPTATPSPGSVTIDFRTVADSPNVSPPGEFERFRHFAVEDGTVVYLLQSTFDAKRNGYYVDGDVLIDGNTPVPGEDGTFVGLQDFSLHEGMLGFRAGGNFRRLYLKPDITVGNVPGTIEMYLELPPPFGAVLSETYAMIYSGGRVGFGNVGAVGVADRNPDDPRNPALSMIADTNTAIPKGSGTFTAFAGNIQQPLGFDSATNTLAFVGRGADDQEGVYAFIGGGSLQMLADSSTPVPDDEGTLDRFCGVAVGGDGVVFRGSSRSTGFDAIYAYENEALRIVAKRGDPVPGSASTFRSFGCGTAYDDDLIAFTGSAIGPTLSGLVLESGGQLVKVVYTGDEVNGRTVDGLLFGNDGSLDGSTRQIVFQLSFEDGSGALNLATLR